MNSMEHNLLVKIGEDLQGLTTASEHRLTELEGIAKNQQDQINECACKNCIKNIRIAIGFLYTVVAASIASLLYKAFGN